MHTSELVYTAEQAFQIILIYAHRWQIEMALRVERSKLCLESRRAFSWEVRQRLFPMQLLIHTFLLRYPSQLLARFN